MKDEELVALMTALSWILWCPLVLDAMDVVHGVPHWLALAGAAMPALAVLVAALLDEDRGLMPWLDDVLDPRGDMRWYLLAGGVGPLMVSLSLTGGLAVTAGRSTADPFSLGTFDLFLPGLSAGLAFPLVALLVVVPMELAMRGWLLPRMQARDGALVASASLAAVHAVWQLPLGFVAVETAGLQAMAVPLVAAFPISVVATWLYNGSDGRVAVSGLWMLCATTVIMSPFAGTAVGLLFVALVSLLAMGVTWAHGADRLAPLPAWRRPRSDHRQVA